MVRGSIKEKSLAKEENKEQNRAGPSRFSVRAQ